MTLNLLRPNNISALDDKFIYTAEHDNKEFWTHLETTEPWVVGKPRNAKHNP